MYNIRLLSSRRRNTYENMDNTNENCIIIFNCLKNIVMLWTRTIILLCYYTNITIECIGTIITNKYK